MNNQGSWHSQDAFWELFEPVLFNQQRQSNAQEEVIKIEKLLQIEDQARILDLCCGNGRHSKFKQPNPTRTRPAYRRSARGAIWQL
jgi:hypothetical protein